MHGGARRGDGAGGSGHTKAGAGRWWGRRRLVGRGGAQPVRPSPAGGRDDP